MTDRDAFLGAICASPTDDLPRLVFADWLDEHGESREAEFIRVACEAERITHNHRHREFGGSEDGCLACRLRRRERELCPGDRLYPPDFKDDYDYATIEKWSRGFPDRIVCPSEWWLRSGDAILSLHPVRRVALADRPEGMLHPWAFNAGDWSDPRWVYTSDRWPGISFTLPAPPVGDLVARFGQTIERARRDFEVAAREYVRRTQPAVEAFAELARVMHGDGSHEPLGAIEANTAPAARAPRSTRRSSIPARWSPRFPRPR